MNLKLYEWTDVDQLQFAYKHSEDEYTYIQFKELKNKEFFDKYSGNVPQLIEDYENDSNVKSIVDDANNWNIETIDFKDISIEDEKEINSTYGLNEQHLTCEDYKKLIIEGFFEQFFL